MSHDVGGTTKPPESISDGGERAGLPEGPAVVIHQQLCKACGLCIANCPKKVLARGDQINAQGYPATQYGGEGCIGCGTCFYMCPEPGAITVIKKPVKPKPKGGGA